MSGFSSIWKAIGAPPVPPETGDGTRLPEPKDYSLAASAERYTKGLIKLGWQVKDLVKVADKSLRHVPWDDKTYLMEHLIQAAANLGNNDLGQDITAAFLTQLWDDLDHPPQTLLGDDWIYRRPDGSGNSYINPNLGKAGMPYARTVAPKALRAGALPDPSVLFDTCMARKSPAGLEHPNKISSMLFYLASIIIHDIFKTDHRQFHISNTSSYLDLAPLYGSDWNEQKKMRTWKDGKIHPDCFSETRLLGFPPGVGALLIMFNRYHNYIAENLARINENGRFTENPENPNVKRYGDPLESINKRDDDLFQTARLVTCGLYINIILIDYVRTILNLNHTDSDWQLDPRMNIPNGPQVGTGNQVAAEFNLVYRWHSAVSVKDTAWTEKLFKQMGSRAGGMTIEEASTSPENIKKFLGILAQDQKTMMAKDPWDRQFPALDEEKLERIATGPAAGKYRDEDLTKIIVSGIEDCANAMGPQQVPPVMKVVEILGIQQARTWRVATLNEFRTHFALKPHEHFSDITKNVEVQEALRHLYSTPDDVELYPGLIVEDAKGPLIPGSGLCPSYTVSRAVLSDAVALVRGDRYYTTSYTPAALTNWGYQEVSSDVAVDNGCVFYKLLSRALPNSFDQTSVYAHYPLTVPTGTGGMVEILQGLNKAKNYTYNRPQPAPKPTIIVDSKSARTVITNTEAFRPIWPNVVRALVNEQGTNFLQGTAVAEAYLRAKAPITPVIQTGLDHTRLDLSEKWVHAVKAFYTGMTAELLREKSYTLGDFKEVDIVRDVGNLINVRFAAQLFDLPLKTTGHPRNVLDEHYLYITFMAIFTAIFFDVDPPTTATLRRQSKDEVKQLAFLVEWRIKDMQDGKGLTEGFTEGFKALFASQEKAMRGFGGPDLVRQLLQGASSGSEVVWGKILPTCAATLLMGQYFANAVAYFLSADGLPHLSAVQKLAEVENAETDQGLLHYFLEAVRLSGEIDVIRESTKVQQLADEDKSLGTRVHELNPGDKVVLCPGALQRDPQLFPDPDRFDPTRPVESYACLIGEGLHQCFGKPLAFVAMPAMLRVVAKLNGLQPSNVSIGLDTRPCQVETIATDFEPREGDGLPPAWKFNSYLTESWNMTLPFPTSFKVRWDPTTKL